ncbi:MAG: molecular chaperone [Rhodanobacteraceae bacterium]|nr:MAG: molecular chaperone [Rhodanobacteraceae bacterium]
MKRFIGTAFAVMATCCLFTATAHADVVIGGTRVVFPAKQGEVTVRLSNEGDKPALVEAWIDTGDIHSTPNSVNTPFLITPPLFRMEPHKDQSLRILYIQGAKPLPTARESLFWLNVLEIPPKPTGAMADKNTLQFAIRSRLKLFYRPANLPGDSLKAPDQLTFKAGADSHGTTLEVHNPTPYYITISKLALGASAAPIAGAAGMVAPFGNLRLPLKGVAQAPSADTPVVFTTINDYGAGDSHKGVVTP